MIIMPGCGHGSMAHMAHGGMMKAHGGMMKAYGGHMAHGGMMKAYGGHEAHGMGHTRAHKKVKSESRVKAEARCPPGRRPVKRMRAGRKTFFQMDGVTPYCAKIYKKPKGMMTPSKIQSLLRRAAATKPMPLLAMKVPSKRMSPLMTNSQAARSLSRFF